MPTVTIRSATFPNCYLRLDGRGVTSPTGPGGGKVNCQAQAGSYETLRLEKISGAGENVFAIGSTAFPNVYLRMDASNVHGPSEGGAGVVNCQFTHRSYESFHLEFQENGTVAIASVQFPGAYLRMDGRGVHSDPDGSGIVNCQGSIGSYENFIISGSS
jgi:hypothetical protein